MNEYKITYGTAGTDTSTAHVTERTEAAATKFFKANFKKGHGCAAPDILNIEFVNGNACATKQQERDALAAIRKMVAELGPQSYLATAFEGTFEDAENNIENDFGDRMKRRYDSGEKHLAATHERIRELETHKRLMQETINRLQQENEEAEARQITESDLDYFLRPAEKDLTETEQRRDGAALKIVGCADSPDSDEFQQAVAIHRNAETSIAARKTRLARLTGITQ